MNYGKLIDNNNVGLKQTLKKILKDVDKRIETSENKECDTTEYETRIQELTEEVEQARETITELTPPDNQLHIDFYIDFNDITFGTFNGSASTGYLAGGVVHVLIPTDNLTGFVESYTDARNAVLSSITINNLIINDVEVNITGQSNSSSGKDIDVTLSFNISPAVEPTVPALENNTISVDIRNSSNGYVRTMRGTFTIDGTSIANNITTIPDE